VAEPGPAHRGTGAHRSALPEDRLIAEPQQRRLAHALVTEHLCALLGNQQLGARRGDTPAGKLAMLFDFYLGCGHALLSKGGLRGLGPRADPRV
uniref:TetR/AcrR family transcriptional regulator n=1 Tax=Steinernema glaseri TaxID=37863 RepID=A0A1I8ABP5_9BILA